MPLRSTLLYLAENNNIRKFVTHNPATRRISHRFVAGETLEEAIQTAQALNQHRMHVALDYLGENVSDAREAKAITQDYITAIEHIGQHAVDANISIKLTALGLDISEELCEQNVAKILEYSKDKGVFVCIDMESSHYTTKTLDLTLWMRERFEHVGTVIQAYLYESRKNLEQFVVQGVRVRLVKGAYKEPAPLAFQNKEDVDANYIQLMMVLLLRGNYPAIATHDESIINVACKLSDDHGVSKSAFEFQMLYGIRRDLQEKLTKLGYNVRIYVPYGSQWYPYLMRRMAERPANLFFAMRNTLR